MKPEVKICGTTSFADLEVAIEAGADAIGIIWHPLDHSRHTLDTPTAVEIARLTPNHVQSVFLPRLTDAGEILFAITMIRTKRLQIGETEDPNLIKQLSIHQSQPVTQVIHVGKNTKPSRIYPFARYADSFLLDSAGERPGGNGITHDWAVSREIASRAKTLGKKVFLAGGLTPDNVAEAIATVRPDGVDVETGIKNRSGAHDPGKVKAFIEAANEAFVDMRSGSGDEK